MHVYTHVFGEINTSQCYCTVFATFRCHCHFPSGLSSQEDIGTWVQAPGALLWGPGYFPGKTGLYMQNPVI